MPGAPGFVADEGLRRGTTPETLAKLKPSFREDGVIHAGNASQISDGASAVLMATPERAARAGAHTDRALPLGRGERRRPARDAHRADPGHGAGA